MNIGFIGLGNMGSGMASNLLKHCQAKGDTLYVLDLNPDAVARLVDQGAVAAESVAQVARDCGIFLTSLPCAREVKLVAQGKAGLMANAAPGPVWFETSTNELADWQVLRAEAPGGLVMIDAPVTGGA